jgi:hypothetical protein
MLVALQVNFYVDNCYRRFWGITERIEPAQAEIFFALVISNRKNGTGDISRTMRTFGNVRFCKVLDFQPGPQNAAVYSSR